MPDLVRRIPTIAVLLIVQGALDLVFGLALAGVAVYIASGGTSLRADDFPAESAIAVAVFGPALLVVGVLKVVAGIRNYSYRGALLGTVALASCVVSMANCPLAALPLSLMIYGLRVYRHSDSERAFLMGRQGLSREWIAASGRQP